MSIVNNPVNPYGEIVQATQENFDQIAAFFNHNHYIHCHLDWFSPLDWLGNQPFLLEVINHKIGAVICAVPENSDIAWIRAFGVCDSDLLRTSWASLLTETVTRLRRSGIKKVVSLALHKWFEDRLIAKNFKNHHNIIVMKWQGEIPTKQPHQINIRSMTDLDLESVERIDHAAFPRIWQNSLEGLRKAFQQTGICTVALHENKIVGYQISTTKIINGHLARLAVHPEYQGQGIGYAIVYDLLRRFDYLGLIQVTVNTQSNNVPSLKLYEQLGFVRAVEEIPVYVLNIQESFEKSNFLELYGNDEIRMGIELGVAFVKN